MTSRNWFAKSLRTWLGSRRKTAARKPLTARPQCEALEDRVVPATLSHLYSLNGTLADQFGGPTLVADGGVLSTTRYSFGPDQGLQLTGAMADPNDYSIVMKMQLASATPFYKKLLDFSERTSDFGLYAAGTSLVVFPGAFGTGNIPVASDFQLALTRDGATGQVRLYLNGVLQQTYGSLPAGAAASPTNVLDFFEDDQTSGFNEAGTGSVDYIALYHGALSDTDVAALASAETSVTTDNTAVTVTEGQRAVNTGHWTGSAFDTVALSASIGTVTKNADGSWSWFYDALDSAAAPQTVSITATDESGATPFATFSLTVTNATPQIVTLTSSNPDAVHASTNGLVTLQGSFTDAGILDTHTVTVNWGDGSAAEQLTAVNQVTNVFSGGHQYAGKGVYSVAVTVADEDGAATTQTVSAVVVDQPPQIVTLTSSNPDAAHASTNGLVTIQGSFVDPGFVETHTVTVSWGDGSAVETLTAVDQVANVFSASHQYAHGGVDSVAVTVTDPEGGTATQNVSAVVVDPPPQIVTLTSSNPDAAHASTNGVVTIQGSFMDPGFVETHTVTVSWGDGSAVETLTAVNQVTDVFSGSHQFALSGVYSVAVTVADPAGGAATQATSADVVVGASLKIVTLTSSNPAAAHPSANGLVTLQGTFSDPGILGTHTVTVNWGDGSAAQRLTAVNQVTSAFSGGHQYAHGGVFSVTVMVADPNGHVVTQSVTAVVTGVGLVNGTLYVVGGPGVDFVFIDLFRLDSHTPCGKGDDAVYSVLTKFASGGAGAGSFGVDVAFFDAKDVKNIVVLTGPEDIVRTPQSPLLQGGHPALDSVFAFLGALWDSDDHHRHGRESHWR